MDAQELKDYREKVIAPKVRDVVNEYRCLLNNAHFRRQAMDELELFMEGLRSQSIIDDYSFAWVDGTMVCRWKFTGDKMHQDVWEKV